MSSTKSALPTFDSGGLRGHQSRIALTAVGGYFVDGYDLLILSGALLAITPEFGLNSVQLGALTAAAFLGMAVGSATTGPLTDRFGRRLVFFSSMALFVLGSVLFLFAQQPWQLIALRFVIGLAIGADMPAAASLIAEFIPARRRGTFTALGGVAWMVGALAAIGVVIGIFSLFGTGAWRWAMATGALGAVVLMILRHGTPESPYWLRAQGREEEARAAWRYATGGADEPPATPVTPAVTRTPASIRQLVRRPLLPLVVCMCVYWGANNLYGSAITLYQPTLIKRIVDPGTFTALLFTACTSALAVVVGLVVCLVLIERIGRRALAVAGTSIVVVAMLVIWAGFHNAAVVVVAFGAVLGFINGGTSMAYYAWAPELFPTAVRGRAVGVVNMVGKLGSVVGTFALPSVFTAWGSGAFLLIGAIALVNVVCTALLSIETKGRSLDDIQLAAHRRYGGAAPVDQVRQ